MVCGQAHWQVMASSTRLRASRPCPSRRISRSATAQALARALALCGCPAARSWPASRSGSRGGYSGPTTCSSNLRAGEKDSEASEKQHSGRGLQVRERARRGGVTCVAAERVRIDGVSRLARSPPSYAPSSRSNRTQSRAYTRCVETNLRQSELAGQLLVYRGLEL